MFWGFAEDFVIVIDMIIARWLMLDCILLIGIFWIRWFASELSLVRLRKMSFLWIMRPNLEPTNYVIKSPHLSVHLKGKGRQLEHTK